MHNNLHKLDNRIDHRKEMPEFTVGADGKLEMRTGTGTTTSKDYPNPYSVLYPLQRYFAILLAHTATVGTLGRIPYYLSCYTAQLISHATDYEWHAVRAYHTLFFTKRLEDMRLGHYHQWEEFDPKLAGQFLYKNVRAHTIALSKSSSTKRPSTASNDPKAACLKWNRGECDTPCKWKRPHICSKCGKGDHTEPKCPSASSA